MSPLSKSMHQKSFGDNTSPDVRLKRISENILPQSPYILTVPSSYRVSSHQVNDWRRGSPFGPNEEQLQYVSFLSHTWDDTMLNAVGNWDDGQGGIAKKSSQTSSRSNSGMATPLPGQPPRKKITLEAYKSKTTGQASAKVSPGQSGECRVEKKVNAPAVAPVKGVKPVKEDPPRAKKRAIEAVTDGRTSKTTSHDSVASPAKKARNSPEPQRVAPKVPAKKTTTIRKLPPLLSPTLPPDIEEELARRRTTTLAAKTGNVGLKKPPEESGKKPSKAPPSSQHDSPLAKHTSKDADSPSTKTVKPSTPKKPTSSPIPKPSNSIRETAHQKLRTSTPENIGKKNKTNGVTSTKLLANGLSSKAKDETSALNGQKSGPEKTETKTLLVKLKIHKSSRKNWVRIIGLRPGPKKPDQNQPNRSSDNEIKLIKDQDIPKAGEKRRRPEEREEIESTSKRQKSSSSSVGTLVRNPHTPARPANKSPVSSQPGSAQKSHKLTPKVELKGTAMRRITSGEVDVQTPSGGTTNGTPTATGSVERAARDAKAPSNSSTGTLASERFGELAFWKAERQKYLDLGRTLKHAADKILKSPECIEDNVSFDPAAKKRGLAMAVETILCYMLAFSVGDEGARINRKAGDVIAWRSILPYVYSVTVWVKEIPHLHGLCIQLGAVCRDTVHAYELDRELDRLERERPASTDTDEVRPSPPGAGTPVGESSSKATHTRRDSVNFKVDFIKELIENARAWHTGISCLPVDELQHRYPKTWAKRSKVPGASKGKERLVAKRYGDGPFYLPLSSTSSGIEAVRMGWNFLGEWCAMEGVRWDSKMGI